MWVNEYSVIHELFKPWRNSWGFYDGFHSHELSLSWVNVKVKQITSHFY